MKILQVGIKVESYIYIRNYIMGGGEDFVAFMVGEELDFE